MKCSVGALAAVAVALSGCVSPLVRPNPLALQSKATNAIHWQELAQRTVAAIPTSVGGPQATVYVAPGPENAEFATVYKRFLEEELYRQHYPVVNTPEGADITLNFDAQYLLYDKSGKKLTDYASLYTSAAAVGGELRHIDSIDQGIGTGFATGIVFDFLASLNGTTNAEVVLSSTITSPRSNHYHFVRTETFYVRPSDLHFFVEPPPPPPPPPSLAEVRLPVGPGVR